MTIEPISQFGVLPRHWNRPPLHVAKPYKDWRFYYFCRVGSTILTPRVIERDKVILFSWYQELGAAQLRVIYERRGLEWNTLERQTKSQLIKGLEEDDARRAGVDHGSEGNGGV